MNRRWMMEFALSNWWLFDKEWQKNHPDTFTDNPYSGHRIESTSTLGGTRVWIDGEEQYIEEWSTI